MARGSEVRELAPTTTIHTLVIVRPLKVISVMLAVIAMLLMLLSVAASTWLRAHREREGLWEKCRYRQNETNMVDCDISLPTESDWLQVCRSLCMLAMIMTFFGIVITSGGLRTDNFRRKYRYYLVGMTVWFVADALQLISLVTFPVQFVGDMTSRQEVDWQFGWAYGVGWGAAILLFVAGLLLLIDKGAEEIVYREIADTKEVFEDEATELV